VSTVVDLPARARRFYAADAGMVAGSALSSLALVWLVYERLTPL
jgi:hypothetical protein